MSEISLVRADGVWHRTDILGCAYADVAAVDEERRTDPATVDERDRCESCTW